jgi:serine/threonine protein kinase
MSNIDTYDDLIDMLDGIYNVSQTPQTPENTCKGENENNVVMSNFSIEGNFTEIQNGSTKPRTLNLTKQLNSGVGGNICNIGNDEFDKYIIKIPKVKGNSVPQIDKAKLESAIEKEAIKLLNSELASNQKYNLLHTHGFFIPGATNQDATEDLTYFIQEKLSESLEKFLYTNYIKKNLNINIINIIGAKMYGIASALKFLNDKKISHLDVSLRNIMLKYLPNTSEKNFILKLIDFGKTKKNSEEYTINLMEGPEMGMCFDNQLWNSTNKIKIRKGLFTSEKLDIWCIGIIYWQIYAKVNEYLSWNRFGMNSDNIIKIWPDLFLNQNSPYAYIDNFLQKLKDIFNDKSNNVYWATQLRNHDSDPNKQARLIGKLIGDNIDKSDLGGKQTYGRDKIKKDDIIEVINGCLQISESERYDNDILLSQIKKIYNNNRFDNNWQCDSCEWYNENIKHHCYICNTNNPNIQVVKSIISTNGALFYNYTT